MAFSLRWGQAESQGWDVQQFAREPATGLTPRAVYLSISLNDALALVGIFFGGCPARASALWAAEGDRREPATGQQATQAISSLPTAHDDLDCEASSRPPPTPTRCGRRKYQDHHQSSDFN